jgi:hypothetical protein
LGLWLGKPERDMWYSLGLGGIFPSPEGAFMAPFVVRVCLLPGCGVASVKGTLCSAETEDVSVSEVLVKRRFPQG